MKKLKINNIYSDENPMMQTSQTLKIKSWGFHPIVSNRTSVTLEIEIILNI